MSRGLGDVYKRQPIEVIDGMQQWMQDNGVKDINEIVGTVQQSAFRKVRLICSS